jgi:thioredoxin 1
MKSRLLAIFAALVFSTAAYALEVKPYDAAAFKAAQAAGAPTVIHIHAEWCPTCKAQDVVLDKIKDEPALKNVVVFRVDYDEQKSVVKAFHAISQSTIIAFKGAKETGRSVGATGSGAIEKLIASTTK